VSDDALRTALLEFLRRLAAANVPAFLGGGYGLYLKQIDLLVSGVRTYLPSTAWPSPRATSDLDVFLPTEVVVEHQHMAHVRAALDELDYSPVTGAEFMHFKKAVPSGEVRVELLTGPIESAQRAKVKINGPRVRPRQKIELHAYLTTEALELDAHPRLILVEGERVLVPNAFTFLLMKLHAFADRKDDAAEEDDRQLGRHHALDVYRLVAMLTEDEEAIVEELAAKHADHAAVRNAARIVEEDFGARDSVGSLRMREHRLAGEFLEVERFIQELKALLAVR
jgi:hypothetical protein